MPNDVNVDILVTLIHPDPINARGTCLSAGVITVARAKGFELFSYDCINKTELTNKDLKSQRPRDCRIPTPSFISQLLIDPIKESVIRRIKLTNCNLYFMLH